MPKTDGPRNPAPASLVQANTCSACGHVVSGRSFDEVTTALLDHAQYIHGQFLGGVWRSKELHA